MSSPTKPATPHSTVEDWTVLKSQQKKQWERGQEESLMTSPVGLILL